MEGKVDWRSWKICFLVSGRSLWPWWWWARRFFLWWFGIAWWVWSSDPAVEVEVDEEDSEPDPESDPEEEEGEEEEEEEECLGLDAFPFFPLFFNGEEVFFPFPRPPFFIFAFPSSSGS